ncbi:MAG: stp 4, partial [Nocardioides sp.]|nr:stp 4 [Nocardioides sp.]
VDAGLRFLFLSAASFVAASLAGRFIGHIPAKWLIGPGFLVLGVGLLLLIGIDPSDGWTHLIPGLTVAGFGVGMINVPLASTAVGVVSADRSGMASGVNSTFRQVGIATGIAALGSIFSHEVASHITSRLAGTSAAGSSGQIADAVTGGQVGAAIQAAPPETRQQIADAATASFIDALNHIGVIAAVIAFSAGLLCLILIRQKDFVVQGSPQAEEARPEAVVAG